MTKTTITYGTLYDYRTGEEIRPATEAELEASKAAARTDGGAGVIEVDGRSCYVADSQWRDSMTTITTAEPAEPGLTAIETDGTWAVDDAAGGRWSPGDYAADEIAASDDPAATAVRICSETPMRGTWRS